MIVHRQSNKSPITTYHLTLTAHKTVSLTMYVPQSLQSQLQKVAISTALPPDAARPPVVLGFNQEAKSTDLLCTSLPNLSKTE